ASLWAATETDLYVDSTLEGKFKKATIRTPGWPRLPGSPRAIIPAPGLLLPLIALSYGLAVGDDGGNYRMWYLAAGDRFRPAADLWTSSWWGPPLWPIGASSAGLARLLAGESSGEVPVVALQAAAPEAPRHLWFGRPIGNEANPYIDATYRYGSTMGGNFQQHQGVEFNNPAGTPVRAIGDGVVVFAGAAEEGSNTIAIRHDRQWEGTHLFSTYYHNSSLEASVGQRVRSGDVIARVGHTGRATNDHLHLELHVAPSEDVSAVVNPSERFPPHTVNPQLWIEPIPGTGIVAGRVVDASGNPVRGARVYGLVLAYPEETPFSFAETYGDRAHPDPVYREHFAVGDVPPGRYLLGVKIGTARVWRRIVVEAGRVTFVEFAP
ncbi:MAG: peptidoglycan DD-metalloendopeptidase family protein, partial [Longimicrobiales bacterium]